MFRIHVLNSENKFTLESTISAYPLSTSTFASHKETKDLSDLKSIRSILEVRPTLKLLSPHRFLVSLKGRKWPRTCVFIITKRGRKCMGMLQ